MSLPEDPGRIQDVTGGRWAKGHRAVVEKANCKGTIISARSHVEIIGTGIF